MLGFEFGSKIQGCQTQMPTRVKVVNGAVVNQREHVYLKRQFLFSSTDHYPVES